MNVAYDDLCWMTMGWLEGEKKFKIHGSWLVIVVGEINGGNLGRRRGAVQFSSSL